MRLRVVTYATHEQGMFRELTQNGFGVPVKVLGMGKPWRGFFDKMKAVQQYAKSLDAQDVVIFLDGFDTRIMGEPTNALRIWKQQYGGRGVLMSKHPKLFGVSFFDNYLMHRIFRGDLNSGMYMGTAADVSKLLTLALKKNAESNGDDQCAVNIVAKENPGFVVADKHELIFKNLTYKERKNLDPASKPFDAQFYSFPGTMSAARYSRVFREYVPMIWPEILALVIVIIAAVCLYCKTRKKD